MIQTVRLECDLKQLEELLEVARGMGISILPDDSNTTVEEPELTYDQKKVLDERRSSAKEEDFEEWEEAKKKLNIGNKNTSQSPSKLLS
jgi:hypothetical protein